MRVSFGLLTIGAMLLTGCGTYWTHDNRALTQTEITTYPTRARIHVDGKYQGTSPVAVVFPQDASGKLTREITIQAIPDEWNLKPQAVVFSPSNRTDRVPSRFMIDLTLDQTNHPSLAIAQNAQRSFIVSEAPWRKSARTGKGVPELKERSPRDEANRSRATESTTRPTSQSTPER